MALPTNVDSTYADSGTDASVALHQQHHDTIHGAVNALAGGTTGQVPAKTSSTDYALGWSNPSWAAWSPSSQGLVAASFLPELVITSAQAGVGDGVLYTSKVYLPRSVTFSSVKMFVMTAISSATAGRTQVGVYNRSGTLLASTATAATATAWGSTGLATIALSSSVTAGGTDAQDCVFVGLVTASGGSTPQFGDLPAGGTQAPLVDALETTYGRRFGSVSGITGGVPSTITPSSLNTLTAGPRIWFGLA